MRLATLIGGMLGLLMLAGIGTSCRNQCKQVVCENESACYDGECLCARWYSGETCELPFNRNYAGEYTLTFSGDGAGRLQHIQVIAADEEVPNRMHLISEGIYFDFENDSLIVIPEQNVYYNEEVAMVSGSGEFTLSSIELKYAVEYGEASIYTDYEVEINAEAVIDVEQ